MHSTTNTMTAPPSKRRARREARRAAIAAATHEPGYFVSAMRDLFRLTVDRAEDLRSRAIESDDHAAVVALIEEIDTLASSMAETSLALCDISDTLEACAMLLAAESSGV